MDGNLQIFNDSFKNPHNFYRNIGALCSFARIKFLNLFKNLVNADKTKFKVRPDV